jgi:hypothetical protein
MAVPTEIATTREPAQAVAHSARTSVTAAEMAVGSWTEPEGHRQGAPTGPSEFGPIRCGGIAAKFLCPGTK